jgi:hypothetical protein
MASLKHKKNIAYNTNAKSRENFFVNWLWVANLENHLVKGVNVSIVIY